MLPSSMLEPGAAGSSLQLVQQAARYSWCSRQLATAGAAGSSLQLVQQAARYSLS
jgi:hypothetical protein